jgi:hypothetical protein
MNPEIIREPITKERLLAHAKLHGDMVKVVVDIERKILALGGEFHADSEQLLLEGGSEQKNLWGANVYITTSHEERIEYTSLINIRPRAGNRADEIQDMSIRQAVKEIIDIFVP